MFKIQFSSIDLEATLLTSIDDLTLQLQYLLSTSGPQQTVQLEQFEFNGQPIEALQGKITLRGLNALIQQLNYIKRQANSDTLLQHLFGALTVISDDIEDAIEQMNDLILAYSEELPVEDHFTNLLFTDNVTSKLNYEVRQIIQQYKFKHLDIHALKQKLFGGLLTIRPFGQGSLLVQL